MGERSKASLLSPKADSPSPWQSKFIGHESKGVPTTKKHTSPAVLGTDYQHLIEETEARGGRVAQEKDFQECT